MTTAREIFNAKSSLCFCRIVADICYTIWTVHFAVIESVYLELSAYLQDDANAVKKFVPITIAEPKKLELYLFQKRRSNDFEGLKCAMFSQAPD